MSLFFFSQSSQKDTQTGHLDSLHATVAMLIFREKACLHEMGEAVLIHEFPATSYCRKSLQIVLLPRWQSLCLGIRMQVKLVTPIPDTRTYTVLQCSF